MSSVNLLLIRADAPTPFVQMHGMTIWEAAGQIPELNTLVNNAYGL